MDGKKRVIILVSIALILAATAIVLNLSDSSEEIPTKPTELQANAGAGEVGIIINQPLVEDKLSNSTR